MSTYLLVTPTEDELYHHGIKGQKWGIRRFQPYLPGSKVKGGKEVGKATKVKQRGGIVEHFKAKQAAHKKSAAVKKAQATRKANTDYEAAKKKAIESGTAEDLAKFKGKLTNEEYSKAFMRLQNEKKLADMVAANQKSVWDTIDSGMKIVERVGKYAGTIATAKENFSKMDEALHKKENDDKKDAKEAAKKDFMNKATYEELVKDSGKYKLDTKEYNMVVARIKGESVLRKEYDAKVAEQKAQQEAAAKQEKEAAAQRKELNAHSKEQAKNLKYGYYKVPDAAPEPEEERKARYTVKRTGMKSSASKYNVRTIKGHK